MISEANEGSGKKTSESTHKNCQEITRGLKLQKEVNCNCLKSLSKCLAQINDRDYMLKGHSCLLGLKGVLDANRAGHDHFGIATVMIHSMKLHTEKTLIPIRVKFQFCTWMLLSSSQCNLSWKKVSKFSDPRNIKNKQKIFTDKKDEHLNYTIECDFMEFNVEYFVKKTKTKQPNFQNQNMRKRYLFSYDCAKITMLPFSLCIILWGTKW